MDKKNRNYVNQKFRDENKSVSLDELQNEMSISRRTISDVIHLLNIEQLIKNKKTNVGDRNANYIRQIDVFKILLYYFATKVLGSANEKNRNYSLVNKTSFIEYTKKKMNADELNNVIKLFESNNSRNYYIIKRMSSYIENNQYDQWKKLYEEMNETISPTLKEILVLDTSVLVNAPKVIDEYSEGFYKIKIPNIVLEELDNLKDNRSKLNNNSVNNAHNANIALLSIEKFNKLEILDVMPKIVKEGKNDNKIVECCKQLSNKYKITFLTNDKTLITKTQNITNLKALRYSEFIEINDNKQSDEKFSIIKSEKFINLVESEKYDELLEGDWSNININYFNTMGYAPVHIATNKNNYKILKFILENFNKKLDINILDKHKYGITPVTYAVMKRNLGMIKLYEKHGADFSVGSKGNNFNNTPLLIAAWNGYLEGVKYILEIDVVSINQVDSNGFTALFKAVIKGHIDIVKYLISKGADIKIYCFKGLLVSDYAKKNRKINQNKEIMELLKW